MCGLDEKARRRFVRSPCDSSGDPKICTDGAWLSIQATKLGQAAKRSPELFQQASSGTAWRDTCDELFDLSKRMLSEDDDVFVPTCHHLLISRLMCKDTGNKRPSSDQGLLNLLAEVKTMSLENAPAHQEHMVMRLCNIPPDASDSKGSSDSCETETEEGDASAYSSTSLTNFLGWTAENVNIMFSGIDKERMAYYAQTASMDSDCFPMKTMANPAGSSLWFLD
jgi:hypothetical protein